MKTNESRIWGMVYCNGRGNTGTSGIYLIETGSTGCTYRNLGGSAVHANAVGVCCSVPGR